LAAKPGKGCGKAVLSLAWVSPLLLWVAPAVAQVAESADPVRAADAGGAADPAAAAKPTHHGHRRPSLDDRIKVLSKSLDLSEAQQADLKKILEQRQQETLRLRTDPSLSGEARIARFRALQDTTVERIRGLLNEEQRKHYNPLAPRELQPAPEQRSVEDWLKLTTPQ
jgi:hypothetical protein